MLDNPNQNHNYSFQNQGSSNFSWSMERCAMVHLRLQDSRRVPVQDILSQVQDTYNELKINQTAMIRNWINYKQTRSDVGSR